MPRPEPCSICGDPEPFHVHHNDERIEDYFTVGRGQSDFMAAQVWRRRALRAEAVLAHSNLFEAFCGGWEAIDDTVELVDRKRVRVSFDEWLRR